MMINNTEKEIIEKLNSSKIVAVFCHVRPDGDALGSGLAICRLLSNYGKTVCMFCEDNPPEKFFFLPAVKEVKTQFEGYQFDTFISVDCADITRLGAFASAYKRFKGVTINIDHHISNDHYAKFNYVEECTATCEIITRLFRTAGYKITEEIANLLMLGLITDSGNFVHNDVTEKTFEVAAYLRSFGADVNLINYQMYLRQPKERAILYGKVMSNIRFALDDKLAVIVVSSDDLQSTGADKSLTEGFVDFPLTIDGVEVSVSLMEFKKNQYKASLRSKGKVNVNAVADTFGGGGHILASGCMIFGSLEEVIEKLSYAVYQNL